MGLRGPTTKEWKTTREAQWTWKKMIDRCVTLFVGSSCSDFAWFTIISYSRAMHAAKTQNLDIGDIIWTRVFVSPNQT